jgi:microcin C transport system permease protein
VNVTLSPVTRRRLAIFRAHRRGYVCFWIFLALFGISLFAEFIANDRPLLIRYDDHWYVPVLHNYPETTWGEGFLPTETDYTDPEVREAIRAHGWMIWPAIPRPPRPRGTICSAPTTRAATCCRGRSTASASRCCSASR